MIIFVSVLRTAGSVEANLPFVQIANGSVVYMIGATYCQVIFNESLT